MRGRKIQQRVDWEGLEIIECVVTTKSFSRTTAWLPGRRHSAMLMASQGQNGGDVS